MKKIDSGLLEKTSRLAKESPRKRMNFNFHKSPDDTLQRLLNAIEPGSYIQPHKHESPDKREVFFSLMGRLAVIEFDNEGNIADFIILDPKVGNFGVEIDARTWHTIISLEPGSVAYEFKDGPYNPIDDKNFASWAPKEGAAEVENYLLGLLQKIYDSL
ncbi:MAG: WbuC family cupin fold metalloprotein [Bacteroidetes bacterium]|nr:WbuC family cupin fold metalloprotein [Bacteroidota bacterium]